LSGGLNESSRKGSKRFLPKIYGAKFHENKNWSYKEYLWIYDEKAGTFFNKPEFEATKDAKQLKWEQFIEKEVVFFVFCRNSSR
jgi:hypothetical protein